MLLLDGISSWLKFKLILYTQLEDWPKVCQKGSRQSPAGICKENSKNTPMPPLEFVRYECCYPACLIHDDDSVTICFNGTDPRKPLLRGGNLAGEYILNNVHFHWKSEHTLNGRRYPLEAHYIHLNKNFENLETAAKKPDGLVIMAVLFEIGTCHNPKLDKIIISAERVVKEGEKYSKIKGGIMAGILLPSNRRNYYMYDGSKTKFHCNDNAKWIIFEEIMPIGEDQLNRLKTLDSTVEEKDDEEENSPPEEKSEKDKEVLYTSDTLDENGESEDQELCSPVHVK